MDMNNKFKSLVVATLLFSNVAVVAADEIIEPTGLDQIHEIISADARIAKKVSTENIAKAQDAASEMNALIKEAIITEGLANDGDISVSDTMEINRYLRTNYADAWADLRGANAYALIEKKSQTTAMNANAVRNIWGNIYNLGFETRNKSRRLSTYQGKNSASFKNVGYNLGQVVTNDILNGSLENASYNEVNGTTGTGLDQIVDAIMSDGGLLQRIPTNDMREGSRAANEMNHLIKEAIIAEGLANDDMLSTADIRNINNYLVNNYQEKWAELHGDDENNEETGYHLVQNDGAYSRMFADNVINSIADGIYHLGFETNNKNRLLNEDGNKNKRFEKVAWWLDTTLKKDILAGTFDNPDYEEVTGTTGTSFDKMIPYILSDEGLLLKVSTSDLREAATAANGMNILLVEAIQNTGIASDDSITTEEVKTLNQYLVSNHATEWAELHGDDEANEETGYHLVQNDGARGTMHGKNTINKLADGIYHLGFETPYTNRLVNEDGNKNVSFKSVAYWLNKSLQSDYTAGTLK